MTVFEIKQMIAGLKDDQKMSVSVDEFEGNEDFTLHEVYDTTLWVR